MSQAGTGSSFATHGITCGVFTHGFFNHKNPDLCWHWDILHQIPLKFVFFIPQLLSVFSFDTFLQSLITGSLCYCSHNTCIYISTCSSHNSTFWAAVDSYIFSLLVELQYNCTSGIPGGIRTGIEGLFGCQSVPGNLQNTSLQHFGPSRESTWTFLEMSSSHLHSVLLASFIVMPLRILRFY